MNRLGTLEEMVKAVLLTNERARDDDRELTLAVWTRIFGVNPWAPIIEVMRNKDLPSQESLSRIRRKIQMTDESLRGSKRKEKIRMSAQVDYIEYAKADTI